ncbi:MAG: hypothetical protein ACKVS8_06390 [Phycisphaerales bacterium]
MPDQPHDTDGLPADLLALTADLDALAALDVAAAPADLTDRITASTLDDLVSVAHSTPADLRTTEARVEQLAAVYAASSPPGLTGRVHAASAPHLHATEPALRLVGTRAAAPARPTIITRSLAWSRGLRVAAALALVAGAAAAYIAFSPARSPSSNPTSPSPTLAATTSDDHVEAALLAFDAIDAAVLGDDIEALLAEAESLAETFTSDPAATPADAGTLR